MSDPEEYLYHVTYVSRLAHIADDGLQPDSSTSIGGVAFDANRVGRVFMSDAGGVSYWFSKASDWAEHLSDDPVEAGLVPVVLRFPLPDDFEDYDDWQVDEPGSEDSRHESFHYEGEIDPDDLEMFVAKAWWDLDAGSAILQVTPLADVDGYPLSDQANPLYWSPSR